MELYEWQALPSSPSSSGDDGRSLLDLSAHSSSFGSLDTSSSRSGSAAAFPDADALRRLRERLSRYESSHRGLCGLSRLRRRLGGSGDGGQHVAAILAALEHEPEVVAVCAPFGADVVSCGGLRWIKVRAAGARRLRAEWREGDTAWLDSVRRLVQSAKAARLPAMRTPQVVVLFRVRPPREMADAIREMGAHPITSAARALETPFYEVPFLVFDTTALVALCSDACYAAAPEQNAAALAGFAVLAEQQRRERSDRCVSAHMEPFLRAHTAWRTAEGLRAALRPAAVCGAALRPICVKWLEARLPASDAPLPPGDGEYVRHVDACRAARVAAAEPACYTNWLIAGCTLAEFRWILETIAGPRELRRALPLLRSCRELTADYGAIAADGQRGPPRLTHVSRLAEGGKVSLRNRVVFGLSDIVGARVLSSNRQILRAAREAGVELRVHSHPARALVEQKLCGIERRDGPKAPPPLDINGNAREETETE